jgi:hypothetical protein
MFASLPAGPLDVVGDVHGELDALLALLGHLGYDRDGHHPEGRTLVFAGDLCDRGPDSPGVIALVSAMARAGRALAVLGNHELNLLRGDRKDGNDWFWSEGHVRDARYEPRAHIDPVRREDVLAFLRTLPLVLERPDLRVIHAAWHPPAIDRLRGEPAGADVLESFRRWEANADAEIAASGLAQRAMAERAAFRGLLRDAAQRPPMLEAAARVEEIGQMGNPIRVATSGLERVAREPYYAGGAWRFVERVRWWQQYDEATPVIVGHYWRQFVTPERKAAGRGDSNLFDQLHASEWHGARANVFCVDFSVGGRWRERVLGTSPLMPATRLGAMRWPERTLVLDSGESLATTPELVPDLD